MKHFSKILFLVLALALVISAVAIFSSADASVGAKIGDTSYATLADALDAAQDGETITLLANQTHQTEVAVSGKTVTINLNGKTLTAEAALFVAGKNGVINVVGSGALKSKSAPIAKSGSDSTGAAINIGNGTGTITVDDSISTLAAADIRIFDTQAGTLSTNGVKVNFFKSTGGPLWFTGTQVRMNNTEFKSYVPGSSDLVRFTNGRKIDLLANNCVFDYVVYSEDVGTASAVGGKATLFQLPDTVGEGSSFVINDSFIGAKWAMFAQWGTSGFDPDRLTIALNRCEIFLRNGNLALSRDHRCAIGVDIRFTDCSFNDRYISNANSAYEILGNRANGENHAYFYGTTRTKYGQMYLGGSTNVTVVPAGYTLYHASNDTTGYPYFYTAETVSAADVFKTTVRSRALFDDLKTSGMATVDNGSAMASEFVQTTDGTNGYFRWSAKSDASGVSGPSIKILEKDKGLAIGVAPYTNDDYNYVAFDADVMTESRLPGGLKFRYESDREIFSTGQDENGGYFDFAGFRAGRGGKVYIEPNEWHHLTIIYAWEAYNNHATRVYVDGVYMGYKVCIPNNWNAVWWCDLTLSGANLSAGDSICFDNMVVKAYNRLSAADVDAGYGNVYNEYASSDPNVNLTETAYPEYNALYRAPEFPVAKAGNLGFENFADALTYADMMDVSITLLRPVSNPITKGVRIYPADVAWTPAAGSLAYETGSDGNGAYYDFISVEGEVVVRWHSNPFNPAYFYESVVVGGDVVAHPAADTNYAALVDGYGVKENGEFAAYAFRGWTADPATGALVTVFPSVTSSVISAGDIDYYAVFEEVDAFYYVEGGFSKSLMNYDAAAGKNVKTAYTFYDFGTVFTYDTTGETNDLHDYLSTLSDASVTIVLTRDYVTWVYAPRITVEAGMDVTLDLNGHTVCHAAGGPYSSFLVKEGGMLNIISSRPGAVIHTMKSDASAGRSVFEMTGGTLVVDGGADRKITIRATCLLSSAANDISATFENVVVDQVTRDYLVKLTGTSNIAVDLIGAVVLFRPSVNTPPFCGAGESVASVSDVFVNIVDSYFLSLNGGAPTFTRYAPAGLIFNIENTVGNFRLDNADPRGENPGGYVGPTINNGAAPLACRLYLLREVWHTRSSRRRSHLSPHHHQSLCGWSAG